MYFPSSFNLHENHPQSVFFDLFLPRGNRFYLAGDGEGGGGPFWDHFENVFTIVSLKIKEYENHEKYIF